MASITILNYMNAPIQIRNKYQLNYDLAWNLLIKQGGLAYGELKARNSSL